MSALIFLIKSDELILTERTLAVCVSAALVLDEPEPHEIFPLLIQRPFAPDARVHYEPCVVDCHDRIDSALVTCPVRQMQQREIYGYGGAFELTFAFLLECDELADYVQLFHALLLTTNSTLFFTTDRMQHELTLSGSYAFDGITSS